MKNRVLLTIGLLSLPLYAAHVDLHKADFAKKRLSMMKTGLSQKRGQLLMLEGSLRLLNESDAIELVKAKIAHLNDEVTLLMNEIPIIERSLDALGAPKE